MNPLIPVGTFTCELSPPYAIVSGAQQLQAIPPNMLPATVSSPPHAAVVAFIAGSAADVWFTPHAPHILIRARHHGLVLLPDYASACTFLAWNASCCFVFRALADIAAASAARAANHTRVASLAAAADAARTAFLTTANMMAAQAAPHRASLLARRTIAARLRIVDRTIRTTFHANCAALAPDDPNTVIVLTQGRLNGLWDKLCAAILAATAAIRDHNADCLATVIAYYVPADILAATSLERTALITSDILVAALSAAINFNMPNVSAARMPELFYAAQHARTALEAALATPRTSKVTEYISVLRADLDATVRTHEYYTDAISAASPSLSDPDVTPATALEFLNLVL